MGDEAAPPFGTLDPEVLRWIEREGDVLVSRNRRTLSQHLREHLQAGGHAPGIFLLRRRSAFRDILEDLILIWEAGRPEEYRDRIEYLPL